MVQDAPPAGFDVCFGERSGSAFAVESVIGVPSEGAFGVTLLRVAQTAGDGSPLPAPLTVASKLPSPAEGRPVYVAGYAGLEAQKRLQPGQFLGVTEGDFHHDCFTEGGTAGAPVVDLGGGLVLGLHYASRWEPYKRGDAVSLWALADEPLLQAAGVKFDEGEAT